MRKLYSLGLFLVAVSAIYGCDHGATPATQTTPSGFVIVGEPDRPSVSVSVEQGATEDFDDVVEYPGYESEREKDARRNRGVKLEADGFYHFREGGEHYKHFNGQWHKCDERGCTPINERGEGVAAPIYFRRFFAR